MTASTGESGTPSRAEEHERARAIVLRTLSRSPRSRFELLQRLTDREVPVDIAEELLDRFEEVGLIDDSEYAAMLVRTRHNERGQARRGITNDFRRSVRGEVPAEAAVEQADADDEESGA